MEILNKAAGVLLEISQDEVFFGRLQLDLPGEPCGRAADGKQRLMKQVLL